MYLCTFWFTALAAILLGGAEVQAGGPSGTQGVTKVYKVDVGKNGLTFEPNEFQADVGSVVQFTFYPKNHTVTQSSFSNPCQPLVPNVTAGVTSDIIHSGFIPSSSGPANLTYNFFITDKKPIWLYCAQTVGNHCQRGMVMAINAPSEGNTFENYRLSASNVQTPSRVPQGGFQGGWQVPLNVLGSGQGGSNSGTEVVSYSYSRTQVEVTTSVERQATGTYQDARTTYLTTYPTVEPTVVVIVTTVPVIPIAGNGQTSTQAGPTASLVPNEGGMRIGMRMGLDLGLNIAAIWTVGLGAMGVAWLLL